MYLSRFEINLARRAARDLMSSPQRLHAAVLAAFPPGQDTATTGRLLWRVDPQPHSALLYLVSPHRPDLTHLVETVGWPTTQTWQTREYTPLLDSLASGDRYAFRLTANPVHSLTRGDGARGKRVAHLTAAQQTDWLLARTERCGFTIPDGVGKEPDVAVHARRTHRFARQRHTVTLATATFQGHLRITDPDRMRQTLTRGIGPAKGYGCGLLTLAPAR